MGEPLQYLLDNWVYTLVGVGLIVFVTVFAVQTLKRREESKQGSTYDEPEELEEVVPQFKQQVVREQYVPGVGWVTDRADEDHPAPTGAVDVYPAEPVPGTPQEVWAATFPETDETISQETHNTADAWDEELDAANTVEQHGIAEEVVESTEPAHSIWGTTQDDEPANFEELEPVTDSPDIFSTNHTEEEHAPLEGDTWGYEEEAVVESYETTDDTPHYPAEEHEVTGTIEDFSTEPVEHSAYVEPAETLYTEAEAEDTLPAEEESTQTHEIAEQNTYGYVDTDFHAPAPWLTDNVQQQQDSFFPTASDEEQEPTYGYQTPHSDEPATDVAEETSPWMTDDEPENIVEDTKQDNEPDTVVSSPAPGRAFPRRRDLRQAAEKTDAFTEIPAPTTTPVEHDPVSEMYAPEREETDVFTEIPAPTATPVEHDAVSEMYAPEREETDAFAEIPAPTAAPVEHDEVSNLYVPEHEEHPGHTDWIENTQEQTEHSEEPYLYEMPDTDGIPTEPQDTDFYDQEDESQTEPSAQDTKPKRRRWFWFGKKTQTTEPETATEQTDDDALYQSTFSDEDFEGTTFPETYEDTPPDVAYSNAQNEVVADEYAMPSEQNVANPWTEDWLNESDTNAQVEEQLPEPVEQTAHGEELPYPQSVEPAYENTYTDDDFNQAHTHSEAPKENTPHEVVTATHPWETGPVETSQWEQSFEENEFTYPQEPDLTQLPDEPTTPPQTEPEEPIVWEHDTDQAPVTEPEPETVAITKAEKRAQAKREAAALKEARERERAEKARAQRAEKLRKAAEIEERKRAAAAQKAAQKEAAERAKREARERARAEREAKRKERQKQGTTTQQNPELHAAAEAILAAARARQEPDLPAENFPALPLEEPQETPIEEPEHTPEGPGYVIGASVRQASTVNYAQYDLPEPLPPRTSTGV